MGKKIYNAKARKNPETIVDNSTLKNVKIEFDVTSEGGTGYDEANALVLPSKKRETKIKIEKRQHVRILNKKQRKHLQAIVDKKQKKLGRAKLLDDLAAVQIPADELNQYTSISQVQTVGVKKLRTLDEVLAKKLEKSTKNTVELGKISSIKGAAKRKLLIEDEFEMAKKRSDPNYVGLESESESEDDDDDDGDDKEIVDDNQMNVNDIKVKEKDDKMIIEQEDVNKKDEKSDDKVEKDSIKTLRPTVYVPVHRSADIQVARLKLPILAEEQQIMETINDNSIIIVAGETGSGKTTQIPQFLYEAGYASNNKIIGVTEPRRVAAIAMSKRVAHEMNLSERVVSYLIRFEGNATPDTRIKFMTDGVLLKEVENDVLLNKYSVIILDEAHERSAYTDILVGLLSRIVPMRCKRGNPLKLIIMSATLRVEDFLENKRLFKTPPPLLKVEARQFPVTVHFQKRTPTNYVEEAYKKTLKIHSKLPEGGILIFVTGQQEVNQLMRRLRQTFPYKPKEQPNDKESYDKEANDKQKDDEVGDNSADEVFDMKRAIKNVRRNKKKFVAQLTLPKINLDDYKLHNDDTEADMHEDFSNDADADIENLHEVEEDEDDELNDLHDATATKQPLWVLPLYSLLSSEKQKLIFKAPPEGCRLCVVSTNVAETSLTIPNIKYVVDCGRQKTRLYDKITGVSAFVVTYTSKASADQRAGRAGRVSAGHCYRLYSSAVYNDEFEDFSVPDIQKKPVDDLMLQMRCMGIDRVINFPFPSPPDVEQLKSAEERLVILGALEHINQNMKNNESIPMVTQLGRVIVRFPVAPRFGKMLALSHQQNLLPYTVCLVAALSVQEVLSEIGFNADQDAAVASKWQRKRQNWAGTGNYELLGDPMVLLRAVGAAEYAGSQGELAKFCNDNGLRLKAITEVRKMRVQLTNEINLNVTDAKLCVDPEMIPPTEKQARLLRQILLTGMGDHIAHKVALADISDKDEKRRLKYAYNCANMEEPVFIHSNSVLKSKCPDWVIYQEAYETRSGDATKMFIRGITAIEPEWLLLYVPLLCNIRSVREEPMPRYNATNGKVYAFVDATFGKAGWELPLSEIEMPFNEKSCCYFGMFLLDGQICEKLAEFKSKLKVTPSSLVKSWSNLNESVTRFKRPLIMKGLNNRQKLWDEWDQNPNFLLEEYHNLLYNVSLAELTPIWPPRTAEASV